MIVIIIIRRRTMITIITIVLIMIMVNGSNNTSNNDSNNNNERVYWVGFLRQSGKGYIQGERRELRERKLNEKCGNMRENCILRSSLLCHF